MPDDSSSRSVLAQAAPGIVGFLHFFTLGAALPLLPLYLNQTLGYSWTIIGVILTAIPFSLLIAQTVVRTLSEFGIGVRLGLSMSHLLAGGVAMAAAVRVESSIGGAGDWKNVFGFIVLYFALLAPSMSWIARIGDASTGSGRSIIRMWRVWGAVGFIAPAWLCESVLIRFPNLVSMVESHEILISVAGWVGLATAFASMLLSEAHPESPEAWSTGTKSSDVPSGKLGMRLCLAVLMIVVVQKCNYLWNAPFFESMMQQHNVGRHFVYRLTVADQVFELLGLLALSVGILKVGIRAMLIAGAFAWLARAVLLAWMSQAMLSGQVAMACLCVAQILQGVAIATFFGTLGVILKLHLGVAACRNQIMLFSVCGIVGMLIGGFVADDILAIVSSSAIRDLFGVTSADDTGSARWLHGWAGVWSVSILPCFLAVILAGLSKTPGASLEFQE